MMTPEEVADIEHHLKTFPDSHTSRLLADRAELVDKLERAKKLQSLTLDNEIRWMRKHEDLLGRFASIRDWKSPDGVLQVKDLEWFKELHPAIAAKLEEETYDTKRTNPEGRLAGPDTDNAAGR